MSRSIQSGDRIDLRNCPVLDAWHMTGVGPVVSIQLPSSARGHVTVITLPASAVRLSAQQAPLERIAET